MANGLVEVVSLALPHLPAGLEGLRIAHVSDLHVRRPRRGRYDRMVGELAAQDLDLVFCTGDYMNAPGDEPGTVRVMERLCAHVRPRLGFFGVFGNHDLPELRRQLEHLPIRWLDHAGQRWDDRDLEVWGIDSDRDRHPDSLALLASLGPRPGGAPRPLRLLLCHYPMYLPVAADLGVDVMFSGHTHGGQCRLPPRRALYNSSDLPMPLSAGILRLRDTLCVVSRGVGESLVELRFWCPPHVPVYTLHRGDLPGAKGDHVVNVRPW